MNPVPENPSRDDRIRDIVLEFRKALVSGQPYDREAFISREEDLSDDLRPILKAIEATEPVVASDPELVIDRGSHSDPSNATVNWATEAGRDSSYSDQTYTHVPGSGGSGSSGSSHGAAQSSSMLRGTTVANYRLIRQLGKGGMGVVFEAEEQATKRRFAVKILSSTLPRTKETVERFLNEASLAASLSHPRTTFVYGAGQDGNQFYIAMELMPGHTLKDLVEEHGPRPVAEAIDGILDVLDGLEAAHTFGIIHRDLKPSNCFLDTNDRVKVGDFGLAKSLVAGADITQTGTFLGTPQFAAPEQIRHDKVDQRTDIFAVGATLYYLLTGQAPFTGDPASVIAKIVADEPPDVRTLNSDVPKSLGRIISRCMNKSPDRRFRTAAELRRLLLPFSSDGTSMTEVGRRMAAFLLDTAISVAIMCGCAVIFGLIHLSMKLAGSPFLLEPIFSFFTYASIGSIFYFTFFEAFWGKTPAKHLLGIRVVDAYGDSPGLWRALMRAFVFPGLFLTSVDIANSILIETRWFQDFMDAALPQDMMRDFVEQEAVVVLKVLLTIGCFASMRRKTGYRGLHEIFSGTRVVRTRSVARKSIFRRLARLWGVSRQREGLPARLGPYRVTGEIGGSANVNVLEGHDESLSRPIWLYCASTSFESGNEARAAVNRPTRQRWLQHGTESDIHWQAVESIDGGPVLALLDSAGSIPWEAGRELLPDLADEILAAFDDGTLPEALTMDQLWLDRNGGLRVLDFPLWQKRPLSESSSPFSDEAAAPLSDEPSDELGRAWHLYREVADRCRLDLETPGGAVDAIDEIRTKPSTREELRKTADRLRAFSETPYALSWDSRLGMTAVGLGVELTMLWVWSFIVAWWVTGMVNYDFVISLGVGTLFAAALPAFLGYVFNGGIAFSLSDFQIRTLGKRQANRMRSALRNLVAWLPLVVPMMTIRVWSFMFSEQAKPYVDSSDGDEFTVVFIGCLILVFSLVLAGIGVLFAILSEPRRALPDLLARTYLVRK